MTFAVDWALIFFLYVSIPLEIGFAFCGNCDRVALPSLRIHAQHCWNFCQGRIFLFYSLPLWSLNMNTPSQHTGPPVFHFIRRTRHSRPHSVSHHNLRGWLGAKSQRSVSCGPCNRRSHFCEIENRVTFFVFTMFEALSTTQTETLSQIYIIYNKWIALWIGKQCMWEFVMKLKAICFLCPCANGVGGDNYIRTVLLGILT